MFHTENDEQLLERLLLPLMKEENALDFLRTVAPNLLSALQEELLEASQTEEERRLSRLQNLRERVQQVSSLDELLALADPLLLPSRLFDPQSALWDTWQRTDLQEALAQAIQQYQKAKELLKTVQPGTLAYPRAKKRVEKASEHVSEVARRIAHSWLEQKEQEIRQTRVQNSHVEWRAETQLQVPVVIGDHLVDYVDAEIVLTLATPQAFVTRTFAVAVIPPKMGIIPALRRINVLRHYLPDDVDIIAVTSHPHHLRALQQHSTHVYLVRESDLAPDTPSEQ